MLQEKLLAPVVAGLRECVDQLREKLLAPVLARPRERFGLLQKKLLPPADPAKPDSTDAQNRALADARTERQQRDTRQKLEGERSALGDWRSRWGFEATPGVEFSRSRRKRFEAASKPTLQGFVGLQM